MLDIKFIRENRETVLQNAQQRNSNVDVNLLLELDEQIRSHKKRADDLRAERKILADSIQDSKGTNDAIKEKAKKTKKDLSATEKELEVITAEFEALMEQLPNLTHPDVVVGKSEKENTVTKVVGDIPQFSFAPKTHWELGTELDVLDNERAAEIAGARFTFLKRGAALLEFALIQHVLATLTNESILKNIIADAKLNVPSTPFVAVVPPVLIRPEIMKKMGRLEPRDERYHIQSDDLYLVGSAEHTLGPLHMNTVFQEEELPLRYLGFSTAFRREAGSYGKDMKGILRLHQFDKLEMETFTLPEWSIIEQDFIVALQEYLVASLELPYQVVQICTGDMGGPDYRQIDIEVWFPSQQTYRETHTSDLMNDYQSRELHIKVARKERKEREFVHTNDATAFAIGRTIAAIMENYQQENGSIIVPTVLQPYMFGQTSLE